MITGSSVIWEENVDCKFIPGFYQHLKKDFVQFYEGAKQSDESVFWSNITITIEWQFLDLMNIMVFNRASVFFFTNETNCQSLQIRYIFISIYF